MLTDDLFSPSYKEIKSFLNLVIFFSQSHDLLLEAYDHKAVLQQHGNASLASIEAINRTKNVVWLQIVTALSGFTTVFQLKRPNEWRTIQLPAKQAPKVPQHTAGDAE